MLKLGNLRPTHGMDNESLLRGNSHPAVTSTIYLGDIALTLLKVMQGHSTPKVVESPKFDEQRWTITTISGDLNLKMRVILIGALDLLPVVT